MRMPFQILAIPFCSGEEARYCALRRADDGLWQFVAGGGEDGETPEVSARREILEETGIAAKNIIPLTATAHLPVSVVQETYRRHWTDIFVIPEYSFAFQCHSNITLSREHTECAWLSYEEALRRLAWDSNKTALYELHARLRRGKLPW